MTKATIKFYPNLGKKSKKTGKVPLYMRIISNSQKAECRLPVEVCESELQNWNVIEQRFQNNKSDANRFLIKYDQKFQDFKYSFSLDISSLSATEILNKITGVKKKADLTVIEYFTNLYNETILPDKGKEEGTKKNYNKALNHFIKYFIYVKRKCVSFSEIDRTLPEKFKQYLITEIPKEKCRMSEVSASGYIKKIKTFLDSAVADGLLETNPFIGYKLKTKSPKKEKLTSMQVRAMYLEAGDNKVIEKVTDIFMFSVYSGFAYGDAMDLKKNDLQPSQEGNVFIQKKRGKTGIEARLFFVSYALSIIDKYKDDPKSQKLGYILPRIDNSTYNKWLKIIAYKVGITFNVTTHTARHTFRVMLNEANVTDSSVRKTMMGHSLQRDIDGTYNEIREQQLLDAKNLYQTFLNNLFEKK